MEYNEKQKLRYYIKELLKKSCTSENREIFSKTICSLIMKQDFYKKSATVMCYYPLRDEVDTTIIMNDILKSGKILLLPKCDTGKKTITPCSINNLITDLKLGYSGIMEPYAENVFKGPKIDLILVPGRCFNAQGYRVGRGEGYYDRFLQNNLSSVKVGVAFGFQIVNDILVSQHDIAMDYIVTEKKVLKI